MLIRKASVLFFAALVVCAQACNCGKPVVTTTTGSISLTSDTLDFGVVAKCTSKGGKFRVENSGRAPVTITVALAAGKSPDFTLGTVPASVEAGSFAEVPVVFTPVGPGEDTGTALVSVTGSTEMPLEVTLHGGPIFPALTVEPDPVDFHPALMALERKNVQLKSTGTSALNITSLGVSATGNPDFSVVPPMLPAKVLPGEFITVRVEYARSVRTSNGVMEILSDDVDAGLRRVQLIPDAPGACSDGLDNDMDGLTDFPADPGCQDGMDSDEYNPAQCVNGAVQPCTGTGNCMGTRTCANGVFGACSCGDAGMMMMNDAGTSCNPNGMFRIDAGSNPIQYSCCDGLGIALVDVDLTTFTIQSNALSVRGQPKQPGSNLPLPNGGAPAMCPSGSFIYTRTITGTCDETYTLNGTFTDANTFNGTYSVSFSGADCVGNPLCGGNDCVDQMWTFSAGR